MRDWNFSQSGTILPSACRTLVLFFLSSFLTPLESILADNPESGIVIYTSMDHGRDEIAIALPFVKAERHTLLVNVTTSDGNVLRITNNQLKELVHPTDLSQATVVNEEGLRSLKKEAEKIRSLQARYPRTTNTLEPVAGGIERTIQAMESGNVLVQGNLTPKAEYEKQVAAARGTSIDITLGGRNYTGAKLKSINGDTVSIMHSGGAASISIEELSDEQIARLNVTSNSLVIEKPEEVAATSPASTSSETISPVPVVARSHPIDSTPKQVLGDEGEPPETASIERPDPEPSPQPRTPISLTDLRKILRECEQLLETVQGGIIAAADLQSFPGGRFGSMKYDQAMREANRLETQMNAALGAQKILMEKFSVIGASRIDDPKVPEEVRAKVSELGDTEKESIEEIPGVLSLISKISGTLTTLENIAPEKTTLVPESKTPQDTSPSTPSLDAPGAETDTAAPGPSSTTAPVPKALDLNIPPSLFFVAGLLFLAVTAGHFVLQTRKRNIAQSSCPRCGTFIEGAAEMTGSVVCHTCQHEFSVTRTRKHYSSAGPLVYSGVATSSALLLVGMFVLIEKATTTPADQSRYAYSDYPTEIAELRQHAEQGDPEAQYQLGGFHHHGFKNFPPDPLEAALWFLAAAKAGHGMAQLETGAIYEMGLGMERDVGQSEYWLNKAANNGVFEAQMILGIQYKGNGSFPYRPKESFRWMRKLAEEGHGMAQFNVGVAYYEGEGVEKNLEESERWMQKSAASGYEPALVMVRAQESQIEDQINAMWRQAAASFRGNSPFSPSSPSTYVPPQYREAERRAYGDSAGVTQPVYDNSVTPVPAPRQPSIFPNFFSSSPTQSDGVGERTRPEWSSPESNTGSLVTQPWGNTSGLPLWEGRTTGEVRGGWTSPGANFDSRTTQPWGGSTNKPLWDNPFTGEVKAGWTAPGPGFDNRSTQHWGQGAKKPLWINRFTGDVKAGWTMPGPGYEKQE